MQWLDIVPMASIIVTNLVTIITLYVHLDNKTEYRLGKMQDMINLGEKRTENLLLEMKEEMKDFHGRLCEIKERNKK